MNKATDKVSDLIFISKGKYFEKNISCKKRSRVSKSF